MITSYTTPPVGFLKRVLLLLVSVGILAGGMQGFGVLQVGAVDIAASSTTADKTDLTLNRTTSLSFSFSSPGGVSKLSYVASELTLGGNWSKVTVQGKEVTTLLIQPPSSSTDQYTATLSNIKYTGNNTTLDEEFTVVTSTGDLLEIRGLVPAKYFEKPKSESSGSEDPATAITSAITIENVILFDENDKEITEVTKKSKPFRVTVIFQDSGLVREDLYDLPDDAFTAFWDAEKTTGFVREGNTRGKLALQRNSVDGFPRFRADFDNVTFNEKAGNIIAKVRYSYDENPVFGVLDFKVPGATVPDEKDKSSEEDKIKPPTPYIVANTSYGGGSITAGNTFTLTIDYHNTSQEIPLENIVLTIKPSEDLSIASANSTHISELGIGASQTYSVDLHASPLAKVGNAEVEVEFKYQYIDEINKKREEVTSSQKFGVPIVQIDQFEVDPITVIDDFAQVGQEFYLTVKFANWGKGTTNKVSVKAEGNLDILTSKENVGNLEAGKIGEKELTIIPNEPGDLLGEVLVQYADENGNQKEIRVPFSIYVNPVEETNWEPPAIPDGSGNELPAAAPILPEQIVLWAVGGVLIAAPIMIYVAKKVKNKESGEFYEDF